MHRLCAVLMLAVGCAGESVHAEPAPAPARSAASGAMEPAFSPEPDPVKGEPAEPVDGTAQSMDAVVFGSARVVGELAPLLPDGARVVGVAVEPVTGDRYVLDARSGLYRIAEQRDGLVAELVFDTTDLSQRYDVAPASEFTDVASLRPGVFAVTAENDGYLIDVEADAITRHFCYLPDLEGLGLNGVQSESERLMAEGIDVVQRTESLSFNAVSNQIVAQPLTLHAETREVLAAEIGLFDADTGEPTGWTLLDDASVAGGMALMPGQSVLLAYGLRGRLTNGVRFEEVTLPGEWIDGGQPDLSGLAFDFDSQQLLGVDAGGTLFEADVERVRSFSSGGP